MDRIRKAVVVAALFLGAVLGAQFGFGGGIPNIPPTPTFNEPSQIVSTLNAFIAQLNGQNNTNGGYAAIAGSGPSLGAQCQNAAAGGTPHGCNRSRGLMAYTGVTVSATAPP